MSKTFFLKIVNPILFFFSITQALTGVFHEFVQGISYTAFELIHGIGGYVFATLALLHIYLNWNWVKNYIHSFFTK